MERRTWINWIGGSVAATLLAFITSFLVWISVKTVETDLRVQRLEDILIEDRLRVLERQQIRRDDLSALEGRLRADIIILRNQLERRDEALTRQLRTLFEHILKGAGK